MRRNSSSNSNRRVRSTIRDVYGFEVPEKLAALYSKQNRTRSAEEKFRTEKWLQFLKDISPSNQEQKNVLSAGFFDEQMGRNLEQVIISHKTGAGTELGARLDILVRKGIPSFLRGHIWSLFLGYDIERDPGLFAFLSTQTKRPVARTPAHETSIEKPLLKSFSSTVFSPKQMESLDDSVLTDSDSIDSELEKTVDQIDKDLNRTFPGHPVMDEDGISVLREILVAFSLHRPDIGYCQGMNFISGLLLLFNKPEDAFWNLVAIIERLLPNQFDSDMLPAVVDKLVFKHLVQMQFPKLAAHLDELAVDVSFLCPHWFLCCFVNALPTESCLRVWDILFWERNPSFLFKVGLALVDYHAENLKKATNSAMAWELLQNMARSAFNSSLLIQTALEKFTEINEEHITNLRTSYQSRVKQQQSIKDLIGRGVGFTLDDIGDENNSPTKILAASGGCLLRHASTDSSPSTGSAFFSDGHQSSSESSSGFGLNSSSRLLQELLGPLQDRKELLPEGIGSKVHELIDRLKEMEIENRQLKMKLGEAIVEEKRINETNQTLKLRLGAAYTELDKKTECLDSMIAKAQTLTEKVASQEEIICKQRRLLCNRDNMTVDSDGLTKTSNRSSRSLKSLLFSGK